jgi:hypothetical protein
MFLSASIIVFGMFAATRGEGCSNTGLNGICYSVEGKQLIGSRHHNFTKESNLCFDCEDIKCCPFNTIWDTTANQCLLSESVSVSKSGVRKPETRVAIFPMCHSITFIQTGFAKSCKDVSESGNPITMYCLRTPDKYPILFVWLFIVSILVFLANFVRQCLHQKRTFNNFSMHYASLILFSACRIIHIFFPHRFFIVVFSGLLASVFSFIVDHPDFKQHRHQHQNSYVLKQIVLLVVAAIYSSICMILVFAFLDRKDYIWFNLQDIKPFIYWLIPCFIPLVIGTIKFYIKFQKQHFLLYFGIWQYHIFCDFCIYLQVILLLTPVFQGCISACFYFVFHKTDHNQRAHV